MNIMNTIAMRSENTLTRREKEIICLIAEENTSKQIAEKLAISIRTVETHRKNLLVKTSSDSVIGLVKYAIRQGWVNGYSKTPSRQ
jgi:DNA-binding CsgD family transcriptional regulator